MLNPRLTNCSCTEEGINIQLLIGEIDCKLSRLAGDLYNNLTLMLNKSIPAGAIIDLLTYKRILQYKYVNSLYASTYSVERIQSKIKLLKYK